MYQRNCPVCNSDTSHSKNFIDENIDRQKISTYTFSSRKEPEWMCYQLIKCLSCELVYAPRPPSVTELASAYHQADFDSSEEANDAAVVYIREIESVLKTLPEKKIALEIGCGSGIFLELLHRKGFEKLVGIEPSIAAIQTAPAWRQEWIKHGIFENIELNTESFDLVCCFMTLEHVQSPANLAQSAYQLLKKGGALVVVTHDYGSIINRVLGKHSPIIDIEHLQLFNKTSMKTMLQNGGYAKISVNKFINYYSLKYWLRLLPIPKIIKNVLYRIFLYSNLLKIRLGINVGNIISVGYKI
jgi:2-polyprenyl-3-methyl-5-hydroxy-6-metoxy-1,4-benzoquinol methylase